MGEDIRGLSIKEFAARTNVSVASVHRFCKKLGLEGFNDLKVELIRLATEAGNRRDVDINFPFDATSTPAQVMERMEGLYQTTLAETQELLDPTQLDHAAKLIANARQVDIYTGSHNLYPAGMFRDRLLSAGKSATCHDGAEASAYGARLGSRPCGNRHLLQRPCPNLKDILPILSSRHVPVIVIGTPYCARIHPGFAAYLTVSDHESMTHRITQFASHIAVQYVSIRSTAATSPKTTPAAPNSWSTRFPTPASRGLSSDERGFSDAYLTSVDNLPL